MPDEAVPAMGREVVADVSGAVEPVPPIVWDAPASHARM